MKTRFIFMMFACAALLCGADDANRAASDKRPDQPGRGTGRPQRASRRGPAKPNLPKPTPKRQMHSVTKGPLDPRVPRAPSPAAKSAVSPNPTARMRTLEGPLSGLRHRSPNPAVVAGPADAAKRNAGAIGGSQVHRRP